MGFLISMKVLTWIGQCQPLQSLLKTRLTLVLKVFSFLRMRPKLNRLNNLLWCLSMILLHHNSSSFSCQPPQSIPRPTLSCVPTHCIFGLCRPRCQLIVQFNLTQRSWTHSFTVLRNTMVQNFQWMSSIGCKKQKISKWETKMTRCLSIQIWPSNSG